MNIPHIYSSSNNGEACMAASIIYAYTQQQKMNKFSYNINLIYHSINIVLRSGSCYVGYYGCKCPHCLSQVNTIGGVCLLVVYACVCVCVGCANPKQRIIANYSCCCFSSCVFFSFFLHFIFFGFSFAAVPPVTQYNLCNITWPRPGPVYT